MYFLSPVKAGRRYFLFLMEYASVHNFLNPRLNGKKIESSNLVLYIIGSFFNDFDPNKNVPKSTKRI